MLLTIKIPDARRSYGYNNLFVHVKTEDEATAYVKSKEKLLRSKEWIRIDLMGREGANKENWFFCSVDEFLNRDLII